MVKQIHVDKFLSHLFGVFTAFEIDLTDPIYGSIVVSLFVSDPENENSEIHNIPFGTKLNPEEIEILESYYAPIRDAVDAYAEKVNSGTN